MKRTTTTLITLLIATTLTTTIAEAARGRSRTYKQNTMKNRVQLYRFNKNKNYDINGARVIQSSHFDYDFELGHKIVLLCVAKGKPRPRITWFKNGVELYNHPYLRLSQWNIDTDKVKVKLEITPARQMDTGTYECQANNRYRVDSKIFKADYNMAFI
ncbi:Uncharacterised protein g8412 [Pycnogonum litorale]